ncbi:MAG: endolytic transglycosylase MltG [Mariprofundaceae bacterium]
MKLWMKLVLISCVLFLGLILLVWQKFEALVSMQNQIFVVEAGASSKKVAKQLEQNKLIVSAKLFRILARSQGAATQIKAGEYYFSGMMNMRQVLDKIVKGDVLLHKVTIPEGLRTQEILILLAEHTQSKLTSWQQALKDLLKVGEEVEGRLLPETYHYAHPISPKFILKQMLKAQTEVIDAIKPKSELKLRIIASIIEKETSKPEERVLVSAAIHNRLRLHMPLQMDPTVIYGMWRRDGEFSGNIHRSDLKTDTPWNTYTRRGLPLTPICNPGAASLRAAAHPADVDYLYFVADGTGGHAFASNLVEHQRNVRQWIKIERKK